MCVWAAAEHYNQRNTQHIHEWRRKRATPDIHIHTERAASKLHNWMTTWKRICTENIHVWEIHLNDWHLSTEISQKNIHDGTTQSTTEIGKYNHRQFTHRCSTSRSSQAGRWSHIDTRQSTGGTSSNQISQTTGSGYVVVSIVAPISCPSGFRSIAAIDVMKRLGCWLCIATLASTPSLSCNLKS